MNTHPNPAYDFYFRALGFQARENLHLIAKDDRLFHYRGVVCKPDFVVLDLAVPELWVLDYKTRQPLGGVTAYEAYQVVIFGLAALPVMEKELCRKLTLRTGILYANDRRLEVVPDHQDLALIHGAIEPAKHTYAARGELRNGRLGASQLARYLVDPDLGQVEGFEARRNEGVRAHLTMMELAPG